MKSLSVRRSPLVALLLFSVSLLTTLTAQKPTPTWNSLPKIAKPQNTGFEEKFKNRHSYLTFQGVSARIPRESVLGCHESLQARVSDVPQGRLISWGDFYRKNISWIRLQNVSWSQVLGNNPLSKEILEHISKNNALTIATYRSNPITVVVKDSNIALTEN